MHLGAAQVGVNLIEGLVGAFHHYCKVLHELVELHHVLLDDLQVSLFLLQVLLGARRLLPAHNTAQHLWVNTHTHTTITTTTERCAYRKMNFCMKSPTCSVLGSNACSSRKS